MSVGIHKYTIPDSEEEGEVLPNLLGLTTPQEVADSEFIGFEYAQEKAIDELLEGTVFDLAYLYAMHRDALGHLYGFAGKLRTVNISKENFSFPPAIFLPEAMRDFEADFLAPLSLPGDLLGFLARMHAELLFIHPFREGNGRTIRMFTNMIYLARTGSQLNIEILERNVERYIAAVQQAEGKEYGLMEGLFLEMAS